MTIAKIRDKPQGHPATAQDELLARRLAELPALESLGVHGRALSEAFRRAGTVERADPELESAGAYDFSSLTRADGKVLYRDQIAYNLDDEEEMPPEELFNTRCHEMTHALQFRKAAACHLRPEDGEAGIFLRPADFLLLTQRMEEDAFAKAVWLEMMAYPRISPGVTQTSKEQRADVVREARRTDDPDELLRNLASSVLDHDADGPSLADYYNDKGLSWYENPEAQAWVKQMIRTGMCRFVRLEPRDILDIGSSFGPNSFGRDGVMYPEAGKLVISAENAERLRVIEAALGVPDEMPTFGEALAEKGLRRGSFLRRCGVTPIVNQPAPGTASPSTS